MEGWVRALIEAIHSSPTQAVIYLSGGASQALGWLMSVPGASNTVLEALVPYSKTSMALLLGKALGWLMSVLGASYTVLVALIPYSRTSMALLLGKTPAQSTSQQTVEEMALLAFNRALKLSRPGFPVVGVGFTGALASTSPKHGDHRFYVSTRTSNRLWISNVTLSKGLRTREEEDKVSSHLLLKAIADSCKVFATFSSGLNESEMSIECEKQFDEDEELQQLIDGKICMKIYHFSSDSQSSNSERKIILSGSFNPLHDGHLKLLEVASSIYGDGLPCFEISAVNADKPPLKVDEIKDRVKQFQKAGKTVIISNQPYFYKKAELFPGSAFVIGADTAARLINVIKHIIEGECSNNTDNPPQRHKQYPDQAMDYCKVCVQSRTKAEEWFFNGKLMAWAFTSYVKVDQATPYHLIMPKYYGGDYGKMLEILVSCKRSGCTFLVGGRNIGGVYKVLEDFEIPEELKEMFISIPEDRFRMDISSTEIRRSRGMLT